MKMIAGSWLRRIVIVVGALPAVGLILSCKPRADDSDVKASAFISEDNGTNLLNTVERARDTFVPMVQGVQSMQGRQMTAITDIANDIRSVVEQARPVKDAMIEVMKEVIRTINGGNTNSSVKYAEVDVNLLKQKVYCRLIDLVGMPDPAWGQLLPPQAGVFDPAECGQFYRRNDNTMDDFTTAMSQMLSTTASLAAEVNTTRPPDGSPGQQPATEMEQRFAQQKQTALQHLARAIEDCNIALDYIKTWQYKFLTNSATQTFAGSMFAADFESVHNPKFASTPIEISIQQQMQLAFRLNKDGFKVDLLNFVGGPSYQTHRVDTQHANTKFYTQVIEPTFDITFSAPPQFRGFDIVIEDRPSGPLNPLNDAAQYPLVLSGFGGAHTFTALGSVLSSHLPRCTLAINSYQNKPRFDPQTNRLLLAAICIAPQVDFDCATNCPQQLINGNIKVGSAMREIYAKLRTDGQVPQNSKHIGDDHGHSSFIKNSGNNPPPPQHACATLPFREQCLAEQPRCRWEGNPFQGSCVDNQSQPPPAPPQVGCASILAKTQCNATAGCRWSNLQSKCRVFP